MKVVHLVIIVFSLVLLSCSGSGNEDAKEKSSTPEVTDPYAFGVDTTQNLPKGLEVGSKAPGFGAIDINGEKYDLYGKLKEGPVVLLFYRGKWCPVCNRYMSNLNDSIGYITQTGAQLVAVTPEIRKNAQTFAENTGTKFPIIADPRNALMNAFDVTFDVTEEYQGKISSGLETHIAENNGSETAKLPVPATYIIDKTGTIIYKQFDFNYRNRATVKDIIENVQ